MFVSVTKRVYLKYGLLLGVLMLFGCSSNDSKNIRKIDTALELYKASYQLGEVAMKQGDYLQAIHIYEQQLQRDPGNSSLHKLLAQAYYANKNIEKALWWARKNVAHTESMENLLLLGRCLIAENQIDDALKVLLKAERKAPENPLPTDKLSLQLMLALGTALDISGQHSKARKHYEKAREFFPVSSKVNNNLALSYLLQDKYDKAIAILEELYRSTSVDEKIRNNLILALTLSGNKDKATKIQNDRLTESQKIDNIKALGNLNIGKYANE